MNAEQEIAILEAVANTFETFTDDQINELIFEPFATLKHAQLVTVAA